MGSRLLIQNRAGGWKSPKCCSRLRAGQYDPRNTSGLLLLVAAAYGDDCRPLCVDRISNLLVFRWKYSSSPPNFWYKTCSKTKLCSKTWKSSFLEKSQKKSDPENYDFIFVFFSQRPLNRNHFPTAFFARARRALSDARGFASSRVHLPGAQAS